MNDTNESQHNNQDGETEIITPEQVQSGAESTMETSSVPQAAEAITPKPVVNELPQATYFGYPVAEIRSFLLKVVLGCLVAAASVAVLAILVGGMGDIAWRSVGTIFIAVLHIGMLFLILPSDRPNVSSSRSVNMVINTLTVIVVASFFTAIANTWGMVDGSLAGKLYATFFVAFIALVHAKGLMDIEDIDPAAKTVVRANYAFVAFAAMLIVGAIYLDDRLSLLAGFYGRLLAASLVIDVTLSIIAAVMHRLYLQKHPGLVVKKSAKRDK